MKKWLALLLALVLALPLCSSALAEHDVVTFGSFAYEPLNWLVLSSDSRYTKLLAEEAVTCMPYSSLSSKWSKSKVRAWLNNTFVYEAFDRSQREALCEMDGDLAWLPTLGDMTNSSFGFSTNSKAHDSSRAAYASSYAIGQGVWVNNRQLCSWYTMTPRDSESMYQVRTDGSVGVARCDRDNVGIRPMIIVRTEALR